MTATLDLRPSRPVVEDHCSCGYPLPPPRRGDGLLRSVRFPENVQHDRLMRLLANHLELRSIALCALVVSLSDGVRWGA